MIMNKYWYVVQNETNKTKKEYLIGFCYGNPECDESTILESMQSYCKSKAYRLALLVQAFPMLPIVNQIYPFCPTEESQECMEHVLQEISDNMQNAL
ncbi:hypothetical protein CE91St64_43270 [Faecalicatena contorta]|nr:hypothetical protein [Muricomes sp. OA1]GKH34920.1 hypothetical protein CE91St64_43270 [Faecalicatena contorta]